MAQQSGPTFEGMQSRLEEIVDEVNSEDISLDDALALYEEAVKLGLAACDLSESDVEAYLAASSMTEEETDSIVSPDEASDDANQETMGVQEAAAAADAAESLAEEG